MSPDTMRLLETGALFVSVLGVVFSTLVLIGAWEDWQDAKAAVATITHEATEIAKERLVTGVFLFWMSICLFVSGVYSMILFETASAMITQWSKHANVAAQAFALRSFWRLGVFGFAFVRWSTRERIRRQLLVK